ncbi:MAG: enoyl-CoA hydratase/isomerase family protein [Candidatus Symbiothrix sp.]|jgi:enoyl-CoA hydratase/carnithine racemase|nr:enoyl-CoA hydratase/isomerase family protein [Candidatus Symbiothrix sp.]
MSQIIVTISEQIATITLSNPGKLNAIDANMWRALREAFGRLSIDPEVRCIILRGEGDKAFAAGGDIKEFLTVRATVDDALHYHEELVARALDAIRTCPKPTIAAIQGACIGGGLEIVGCCDIRIAGESAKFGAPINRLGFSMYPGEMAGLLAIVSPAVVLEILLEGRIFDAGEAYDKGILTRVISDESVIDEAYASARRITAGAPLVAQWHKQWIARLLHDKPLSEEEKRSAFAFLDTGDYKEGMDAFFEKRKPQFKGA